MSKGFVGFVMKNNVKVSEFPLTVKTLIDGSQRATYNAYDFIGAKGLRARDPRYLWLRKKYLPITKIFRYNSEWDTLTDRGCISYWDQTTQAQIPAYALMNNELYNKVIENQKRASDVLYYCLDADALIDRLMAPQKISTVWDAVIPALLIGGIIMTAVMNIYAASQYLQAWGVIKGTTGLLGSLQHYFQSIGGIPTATIIIHGIFPIGILGLLKKKEEKTKQNVKITEAGTVNVLLQDKGLITNQITTVLYSEIDTTNPESPIQRYFIVLNDGNKKYKLVVNLSDGYTLKGISNSTIYVQLQRNNKIRFRQLSLSDVGIDPNKAKPIDEDMGKVLAKIYQDNINMKKKPESTIAGLTKTLFYAFALSVAVYVIMYGVNIYFEYLAINALHAAASAWSSLAAHIGYHLAPVVNSTNTTIASNIIIHASR